MKNKLGTISYYENKIKKTRKDFTCYRCWKKVPKGSIRYTVQMDRLSRHARYCEECYQTLRTMQLLMSK